MFINFGLHGQEKGDFSRFVVVGDSLSAGYQNAQLISTSQVYGYANVIATQAGVSLNLPLIPPPGYPQITIEQGYAIVTGLTPVPRAIPVQQTSDVAVPGFNVAALVGLQASCPPDPTNAVDVMAVEILNPNCSIKPAPTELQEAAGLNPTTSILWIGSNDVLYTLLYGTAPTNILAFSESYYLAASTMAHASKHLVVANIPDVTLTAYLTSEGQLATEFNLPVSAVEAKFCLQPGDMVTPYAFPLIVAGLSSKSSSCLPDSGSQGPIVIRAATLSEIRETVIEYNIAIAIEAALDGATVVDIYSLVNNLAANGVMVDGHELTTAFGGGLFSLDGIHPTNTGYAIIANEFITTMNRSLGTNIPPISLEEVSKTDPLFPNGVPTNQAGHVSVGMANALQALRGRN
jgi:hypothetical protein